MFVLSALCMRFLRVLDPKCNNSVCLCIIYESFISHTCHFPDDQPPLVAEIRGMVVVRDAFKITLPVACPLCMPSTPQLLRYLIPIEHMSHGQLREAQVHMSVNMYIYKFFVCISLTLAVLCRKVPERGFQELGIISTTLRASPSRSALTSSTCQCSKSCQKPATLSSWFTPILICSVRGQ